MEVNKDKVKKYDVCRRCANNGCRFCKKCDGVFYFKVSLSQDPILCNSESEEKKKKAREYQQEYFQKHKAELRVKRRGYFRKYYHKKIKKNSIQVELRRVRGLKYYYDNHEEIRAKRNAKKKADLQDQVKGEKMRSEHTEYMRGYRKKKKLNKDK